MSERWIPVLAAALGVLGGVGGALAGGWVANEGQDKRFDRERAAAIQDLRFQTYAKYLQTVDRVEAKIAVGKDGTADYVVLKAAEAGVSLLANSDLRRAVERMGDSLSRYNPGDEREYRAARSGFITVAQHEITTGD